MIRNQRPGKARESLFRDQPDQPIDEVLPIGVILKIRRRSMREGGLT